MNRREPCTIDTCTLGVDPALYFYRPSLAMNSALTAIFALSLLIHIIQGVRYKTWSFLTALFFGGVAEVIGYVARIMSWRNPWDINAFLAQICCLTIAPAFFAAGIYLCLSRIVTIYGAEISRIRPVWYTRLFVGCDFVSLVLQGAGGGMAAVATQNGKNADLGNNIMLAGVVFQVFTLTMFIALCVDFAVRVMRRGLGGAGLDPRFLALRATWKFRAFLVVLAGSTLLILARSVFRMVEMSEGWTGELIRDEVLFFVLEGVMVVCAVVVLNVLHPGMAMGGEWGCKKAERRGEKGMREGEVDMEMM